MAQYTQRKLFEHRTLAEEQEKAFHSREFRVNGMATITRLEDTPDGCWLYLTQEGPLVSDDHRPILPDYELVD